MVINEQSKKKLKNCHVCNYAMKYNGGACVLCKKEDNKYVYLHSSCAVSHPTYGFLCLKHAYKVSTLPTNYNLPTNPIFCSCHVPDGEENVRCVDVKILEDGRSVAFYVNSTNVFYWRGPAPSSFATKQEYDALQRYLFRKCSEPVSQDLLYRSYRKTSMGIFKRDIFCDKYGNQIGVMVDRGLINMLPDTHKLSLLNFCQFLKSEQFKQQYPKSYYQNAGRKRISSVEWTVKNQIMELKKNGGHLNNVSSSNYKLEGADFTWEEFKKTQRSAYRAFKAFTRLVSCAHACHGFSVPSCCYDSLDWLFAFAESLNLHYDYGHRWLKNTAYTPFIGMPQWQIYGRKWYNFDQVDIHGNFSKQGLVEVFSGDVVYIYSRGCWWFAHGVIVSKGGFYFCGQFRGVQLWNSVI